ncbi:hypothetical protein CC78DRAFT_585537 [Lojkania enalia]|uniref:Uncharacterized protein n=1 Tax=Lojkania enalia TaxID=147567 RepID=A0A9P4K1J9_9PLEO|nr:hypothetical protein CC78DRAFT_585537 [Didymosphaeria enalia]
MKPIANIILVRGVEMSLQMPVADLTRIPLLPRLRATLSHLPPSPSTLDDLQAQARRDILSNPDVPTLVALDDDLTGTQTATT